jgi:hypothetical protein
MVVSSVVFAGVLATSSMTLGTLFFYLSLIHTTRLMNPVPAMELMTVGLLVA